MTFSNEFIENFVNFKIGGKNVKTALLESDINQV
jgi:hypothetical protein